MYLWASIVSIGIKAGQQTVSSLNHRTRLTHLAVTRMERQVLPDLIRIMKDRA